MERVNDYAKLNTEEVEYKRFKRTLADLQTPLLALSSSSSPPSPAAAVALETTTLSSASLSCTTEGHREGAGGAGDEAVSSDPFSVKEAENWPSAGSVEFKGVVMHYRYERAVQRMKKEQEREREGMDNSTTELDIAMEMKLEGKARTAGAAAVIGLEAETGAEKKSDMKTKKKSSPALTPALSGVSFSVEGGSKVGIVGRTGAGKSSLGTALFRIVPMIEGQIIIDGVDISTIPLTQLRQSVCVIPQSPLLFSGTLRFNLDPFRVFTDAEVR